MNTQSAIQQINQKLAPIYLVLGTESYLQEQIRKALLAKIKVLEEDDLNFATFDLEEDTLSDVIAESESLPFFGDQRMVFVENPYFLTGEKRVNAAEQNVDALLEYLGNPLESTVLVFFAHYEKLDERKKITKALKKYAVIIDVNPPKEEETRRYVQQLFENENLQISRDAFDLFLRLTDMNLSKIVGEFQKLTTFAGADGKITVETINDLIPKTLEHNIFEITNYVLSGKAEAALRLFDDLVLQGEEPIKINAILLSQIRIFLQTKVLMNIGYQQGNIASTLGIHPYRVKLAMQQVRRFSLPALATIYDELVENDYLIKTGRADKNLLFQLFVLKIAGQVAK